jgi:hypothetical protein
LRAREASYRSVGIIVQSIDIGHVAMIMHERFNGPYVSIIFRSRKTAVMRRTSQ